MQDILEGQHRVLKCQVNAVGVREREPVRLNHFSRYTCLDQEQQDIQLRYDLLWVWELDKGHILGLYISSNDVPPIARFIIVGGVEYHQHIAKRPDTQLISQGGQTSM